MQPFKRIVDKLLILDDDLKYDAIIMYSVLLKIVQLKKIIHFIPLIITILFASCIILAMKIIDGFVIYNGVIIITIMCFVPLQIICKCFLHETIHRAIEDIKFKLSYNYPDLGNILYEISKIDKRINRIIQLFIEI